MCCPASTLRFLSVLIVAFAVVIWTSSTGTSHVLRDGTPLKRSEAVGTRCLGAFPPVLFLAIPMTLAISDDVLRFLTEWLRLAGMGFSGVQ